MFILLYGLGLHSALFARWRFALCAWYLCAAHMVLLSLKIIFKSSAGNACAEQDFLYIEHC